MQQYYCYKYIIIEKKLEKNINIAMKNYINKECNILEIF